MNGQPAGELDIREKDGLIGGVFRKIGSETVFLRGKREGDFVKLYAKEGEGKFSISGAIFFGKQAKMYGGDTDKWTATRRGPPTVTRGLFDDTIDERVASESPASATPTYRPSNTDSAPAAPASSGGGEVHVKGYTRKDGTYVAPYTRRKPSK